MNKIIAHRGLHNNIIKENTYLSISNAFNNKYIDGIECDIRLTKDNKLVLIHDSYINRTSNGYGKVENMTLEELYEYNFGSNKIHSKITTLDKILDIKTKKIYLLEIKINNNIKIITKILTKLLSNYKDKNIYITSFNKKFLKYFKKYNKFFLVGPITLNNNIKNKFDFYVLSSLTIKDKSIKYLKRKKKDIFIWQILSNNKLNNYNNLYFIKDRI